MSRSIQNAAGAVASRFCLGAMNWGTKVTDGAVDRLYDAFRDAGGNFFDSAHVYACWIPDGHGASERALGEIVRRRGDRDNVVLATKGGHPNLAPHYSRPDAYLSAEVIAQDVADSLDRLGVDSIDLYFLHRDDPRVGVREIIDVLDEHVRSGRIGQIGASNWTTARIAEANAYATARGKAPFAASQAKLSLGVARPSKDVTVPRFTPDDFAWHERTQIPLCAYTSTASGYFATEGAKGAGGLEQPVSAERLQRAMSLASELGVSTNQVALAWLMHQPFPLVPILGTSSVDHLIDALGAAAVSLTPEQTRELAFGQSPTS